MPGSEFCPSSSRSHPGTLERAKAGTFCFSGSALASLSYLPLFSLLLVAVVSEKRRMSFVAFDTPDGGRLNELLVEARRPGFVRARPTGDHRCRTFYLLARRKCRVPF